jgi:hypothetical protein
VKHGGDGIGDVSFADGRIKMNTKIALLIFVLGSVSLYAADTEPNGLRQEKIYKLVGAIWKDPPESIDVTLYEQIQLKPKTREELEKYYEDIFAKSEGPRDKLPKEQVEMRNRRDVQLNVEKDLKERKFGRKIKERIIIDGYRQRIDEVTGREMKIEEIELGPGPNTPYTSTFVNLGNPKSGDYTFRWYNHSSKNMTTTHQKGLWPQKSKIGDLTCLPEMGRLFLRASLGKKEGSGNEAVFVPDELKIGKLIKDEMDKISVNIRSDVNEPASKDVIEIKMPKDSRVSEFIVCDKNDYSKIYRIENINPLNGKPLFKRECDNFDKYGFPHNAAITEYDMDGNVVNKKVYKIEKVEINPVISDEVFNFNPPQDYRIVEVDPNGTSRVIREKGGLEGAFIKLQGAAKTKDIDALKALLESEFPKIRLASLQLLEHFLAQNTEELKGMAELLENDEDSAVRQEATKVLLRLGETESSNLPKK